MQPPPAQSRADSDDDEGAPVCSGTTSQKVGVARQYTEKYYDRVARDGRRFAKEHSIARQKKKSVADFHVFKLIGRGAFGEVRLCYRLDDPERTVLAMKILHKAAMIQRRQVDHVRAERDLLVEAKSRSLNEWSVELYYTFQDEENLYMVMEFCPGGDLMSWLIKYDIFPEDVARFYTAELVMAINALHKLGYAHRDVKPDNCLIDSRGHLKLTDFGLSKQAPPVASDEASGGQAGGSTAPLSSPPGGAGDAHDHHAAESAASRRAHWRQSRSRALFFSTVGSPGYIAPEVLARGGQGYGMECDWWGVGIILYEMLCGYPPFYDDDTVKVSHKIAHFNEYLEFPTGSEALGRHAVDLIKGLICEPSRRLQFAQIVTHPFFAGIDWTTLRMQKAPFEIALSSPTDTRYFDELEDNLPLPGAAHASQAPPSTDTKYLFYGFTSRFDKQGMSTRATTRREPRPGLPEFDDEDEEEGGR